MDYARAPQSIDEILKLVARSAAGRDCLERFLPLYHRKQVRIEGYPAELVTKLREALPEGQPIGACFVHEGSKGVIYLDLASPLGIVAPFLVHEIVHALDRKVWDGSASRAEQETVNAEVRAFETQFRFTQELKERDPEYAKFMTQAYPKAKILHEWLEREDIEALYGAQPQAKKLAA